MDATSGSLAEIEYNVRGVSVAIPTNFGDVCPGAWFFGNREVPGDLDGLECFSVELMISTNTFEPMRGDSKPREPQKHFTRT